MQGSDPVELSKVLQDYLLSSGLSAKLRWDRLQEVWQTAAGDQVARHTRVVGQRKGTLTVEVDSPARLLELSSFGRYELLPRLQEQEPSLQDLRFRLGVFDE